MKLKSQLRESSLEQLQSIAEFWGLRPEEPSVWDSALELADYLYPRLQTPPQFKQAFDRLELSERELIYLLALHGGELPVDEFRRRSGLHDDQNFAEALSRLRLRGFLARELVEDEGEKFDLLGVPEPFVRLIDLPPYWKDFLGHYLQALGLDELRQIARQGLGARYEGRRKQVLVHFIRERLLDPRGLRECLNRLSPPESELFHQILLKTGACVWRDLLDGGAQKKFNHSRADLLQKLTQNSGLVFVSVPSPNHYNNLIMVPRDIRHTLQNGFRRDERTLAELSRSADRSRRQDPSSPPRPNVILDNSQNLLRDLVILCAYTVHHPVKILNNGGVGRNDLKKIVPLMSHNKSVKYAAFLALFAMSKKLLIPVGERWRVSKGAQEWLADSRRCFRELYEFWLTTSEWNEEYIDGDVLHVESYPQNLISATELRKLILRVMEKIPPETWIDFDTFAESLLPQVAIEIPGRFDHAPAEKYNRHTKLIIESVIAEPFYWFGLVTLGVSDMLAARELGSRPNESIPSVAAELARPLVPSIVTGEEFLLSFKVSQSGRQIFDGRYLEPARAFSKGVPPGVPYAEETMHVTVQPNLEIVTPPDLNLSLFYRLLMFAEVKKVDIMTTLAITRESVRMGMERGFTAAQIVELLRECSRRELPETIVQLVDECASRHGEIELGFSGGYIAAADKMHVEEIRANPRINKFVKDVFGERLVVLNRTVDLNKIASELQKMGFLPRVASDTLHVTGEGLFHVTLKPDQLYELLAVLNFAQSIEEDFEGDIFEERLRPLIERLTGDAKEDYNPDYYVKPLLKAFRSNYEKRTSKKRDDEKRKLKKQVNRLLERVPRKREPPRFTGENPCSDPAGIAKLLKFAIESEAQVKIHYQRSTGEEIDEVIEPESLQAGRLYAFCPEVNEHHLYAVKRILQAAI